MGWCEGGVKRDGGEGSEKGISGEESLTGTREENWGTEGAKRVEPR